MCHEPARFHLGVSAYSKLSRQTLRAEARAGIHKQPATASASTAARFRNGERATCLQNDAFCCSKAVQSMRIVHGVLLESFYMLILNI